MLQILSIFLIGELSVGWKGENNAKHALQKGEPLTVGQGTLWPLDESCNTLPLGSSSRHLLKIRSNMCMD